MLKRVRAGWLGVRAVDAIGDALVLVLVVALLVLPMWTWGPVSGHDARIHLNWISGFRQSLEQGCWYPRWLGGVNNGFGSPTFVFYFPAFAYVTALLAPFLPDLGTTMWVVAALALWMSGMAMMLFIRAHASRAAALVAGIAYMTLPYRLVDLYERSALPESVAFLWPPLILAAMDRHAETAGRRWLAVVALGLGGLTFTHHGVLVLMLPIFVAAALLRRRPALILAQLGALALGLASGAMSILPAVVERRDVHWGEPFWPYAFLYGDFLSYAPWFTAKLEREALFYAAAAVVGLALAWRIRDRRVTLLALAGLFAVFLATSWSEPIWWVLLPLQVIDFPWRWLVVATFSTSALAGLAVDQGVWPRWTALVLVALAAAMGANDWIRPARYDPSLRSSSGDGSGWVDSLAFRPRAAPTTLPAARPPTMNAGWVRQIETGCSSMVYDVAASREASLEIDVFSYPGWTALVDGEPVAIRTARSTGLIVLRVPKGRHRVTLAFADTPLRAWSARLSLLSAATIVLLVVWPVRPA